MKNKDKTIALALLALLLYGLFVWHGMTYEPVGINAFDSIIRRYTPDAFQTQSTNQLASTVKNQSGAGPADYLKTLGLTVYTDAEFSSIGDGGSIFSNKPKMTLFAYMPMPQGDAIVWHDGREGYICVDMLGILTDSQSSLKQIYADMCRLYDFQLYMARNGVKRLGYAKNKNTISAYTKQTGNEFDNVYGTVALYTDAVSKL